MAPKIKASPALLVVGLNSLVALAAVGFLAYTKLVYKRPVITEAGERARIERLQSSPRPLAKPGVMVFEPLVVNIESAPPNPRAAAGTNQQIEGKYHYATVGFTLEVRDESLKPEVEVVRALILDKFLSLIGRKNYHELTTVQGRYLLKTQLIEAVNAIVSERTGTPRQEAAVTNLFFSQFIVQ